MKRYWLAIVLIGLMALAWPAPVRSETKEDLGLWTPVYLNLPVSEKWSLFVEGQTRWSDDIGRANQLFIRPVALYKVTPALTLGQGYAWFLYPISDTTEHRVWQQGLYTRTIGKLNLEHRARLEERFLEGLDTSLRARYRFQAIYPLGKTEKWSIVASNEVFIHLTSSSDAGIRQGFDQNRLYAGIRRNLGKQTFVEGGYLMQYINLASPMPDALNHIIMLSLGLSL